MQRTESRGDSHSLMIACRREDLDMVLQTLDEATKPWDGCLGRTVFPIQTKAGSGIVIFVDSGMGLHHTWHSSVVPTIEEAIKPLPKVQLRYELIEMEEDQA